MTRKHEDAPCWVVLCADGTPWDEDRYVHHDDREEAQGEIDDNWDDAEYTPEAMAAEAAVIAAKYGEEAGRRSLAYSHEQAARFASLHPVELSSPCYRVTCDGRDGSCGNEPKSDEYGYLHFGPGSEFFAPDWDFSEVDGKAFCDDCRTAAICSECDGLKESGYQERDGMCVACWATDQVAPGIGQSALEIGVTS